MAKAFTIELDEMNYNLRNFDRRARNAIDRTLRYQAARSETWMRTNASWTDRTGNARNGLHATVDKLSEDSWLLVLAHSVSYGIWLEVMQSGRFAIVRPAFLKANKETMDLLGKLFARMEKGR